MPYLREISAYVTGCGTIDSNGTLCYNTDWQANIKKGALAALPSNIDVICIPGGGVDRNGYLPPWIVASLDCALAVQNSQLAINSKPPFFLAESKGSPHAPEIRIDGQLVLESERALDFLVACGVDKSVIANDRFSVDTIGNAYIFRLFLDGMIDEKMKCDVDAYQQFKMPESPSALIIGADYHMPRLAYLHRRLLNLGPAKECNLYFIAVDTQDYLLPTARQDRFEKERTALGRMQTSNLDGSSAFADLQTLLELERWMFTHHNAYNGAATVDNPGPMITRDDYCYDPAQNLAHLIRRAGKFAGYADWLNQISTAADNSHTTNGNGALIINF